MKVCIISHSNVAPRQQAFWKSFSTYADVLVLSPKQWGRHKVESSQEDKYEIFTDNVANAGDMFRYYFSPLAFQKINEFQPDIIYNQNDLSCDQTIISQQWAQQIGSKFVLFCWENIKHPSDQGWQLLHESDLIICGNAEAKKLHGGNVILPQVGISCHDFKPNEKKDIDVLYLGRAVPEKGIEYIKEAYPNVTIVSDAPYAEVPTIMGRTKIFVSYPYDTPQWKEQFAAYSNIEALASGCVVITSDTAAIKEWLGKSPSIVLPMKRADLLKALIESLLRHDDFRKEIGKKSVEFVKKFDNDVIAQKLYKIFDTLVMS